jgi:hypothetical protein
MTSLSILCDRTESFTVNCKFSYFNQEYGCDVENIELITSKENRDISQVKSQHLDGKANNDVKWLIFDNKEVKFFPRSLTKFFKNVETVKITNSNLQEITQDDLKEFGKKLKKLCLGGNEIEFIERNLFKYNANLEEISLTSNKIVYIESRVFDDLKKLSNLNFNNNPCTKDFYGNNINDIRSLEISCAVPKTITKLRSENLNFFNDLKNIFIFDLALILLICALTISLMLYELNTQNKNLKIHLENAFDNVDKLSKEIGKLEYFCEGFEGKVENGLSHVHQKNDKISAFESIGKLLMKINDNQALNCDYEKKL